VWDKNEAEEEFCSRQIVRTSHAKELGPTVELKPGTYRTD